MESSVNAFRGQDTAQALAQFYGVPVTTAALAQDAFAKAALAQSGPLSALFNGSTQAIATATKRVLGSGSTGIFATFQLEHLNQDEKVRLLQTAATTMVGAKVMTDLDQITTMMHGRTVDLTLAALLQIVAGNQSGATRHLTLRQPAGGPITAAAAPEALATYLKAAAPTLFTPTPTVTTIGGNTARVPTRNKAGSDRTATTPPPSAPTGSALALRMHLLAKQFESSTKDKTIGPGDFIAVALETLSDVARVPSYELIESQAAQLKELVALYSVTKAVPAELTGGTGGTAFQVQLFCDQWREQTAGYDAATMPGLTWRLLQRVTPLKAAAKKAQTAYNEFAASLDLDFKFQRNRRRHQATNKEESAEGDVDGSNPDGIETNSETLWAAIKALQKEAKREGDELSSPPKHAKPTTGLD